MIINFNLPSPLRTRWQPLRSGLVNLFKYDQEEFHFEDGRMLLRGNNGTGKSRVLALQLPFLLDGETAPHRVEPDGDPGKRIEWNLLMDKHDDRLGYTWIEFGRRDPDGTEHFITLGCGMKAIRDRGITGKWFFLTPQRIGDSLHLVSAGGLPHTRERLQEALQGSGRIYVTAREYRAAVDDSLFKLGEHRYEALVNLLIQLRKPQLAREFNEGFLSSALSEALTPLDPIVLSEIAEAYRGLDSDRSQLQGFSAAKDAVTIFLEEYSGYSKVASRRRAERVRKSHSEYDDTQRRLKSSETEFDAAILEHEKVSIALTALAQEQAAAQGRVKTLENSPEMRSARELQTSREEADRSAMRAEKDARDLATARALEEEALDRMRETQTQLSERCGERHRAIIETRLAWEEAVLSPALSLTESTTSTESIGLRKLIDGAIGMRKKAMVDLEDQEASIRHQEAMLEEKKRAQSEASRRVTQGMGALADHKNAFSKEFSELKTRSASWVEGLRHIKLGDVGELLGEIEDWGQSGQSEWPLARRLSVAAQGFEQETAVQEAELKNKNGSLSARRLELEREQAILMAGSHAGPEPRCGINPERRRHAVGAPFWKVVDFKAAVSDQDRAGLEAALEASGLLDAWITPDGKALSGDESETLLAVGPSASASDGIGAARWLEPAIDLMDPCSAALSKEVILALLGKISVEMGGSSASVAVNGSWQLGPLQGRWCKPMAQHIGHGAREAEKRRRLHALEKALLDVEGEEKALSALFEELKRIRGEARSEKAAIPSAESCKQAANEVEIAVRMLTTLRAQLEDAECEVRQMRARLEERRSQWELAAEAFGLRGWLGRLRELREKLASLDRVLSGLWPTFRLQEDAAAAFTRAEREMSRTHETCERLARVHQEALVEHATACATRDELEATVGASVELVMVRHDEAKRALLGFEREIKINEEVRIAAQVNRGVLNERVSNLRGKLVGDTEVRETAVASLKAFVRAGLLTAAVPGLEMESASLSIIAWVELARKIEQELLSVDSSDVAWERRSRMIYSHFNNLQAALGALSYRAEGATEDELFVVRIPFQQQMRSVAEALRAFTEEVELRQRYLDAREREIIENHLIGEVSTHIHDCLHAAEEWVLQVNRELDERPTTTGMRLRFAWEVRDEGPAAFAVVRKSLMRSAVTWSEEDRTLVTSFLQQRLQTERLANQHRTWFDNLAAAFDYRSWHRFVVERQQEVRWQRLTKRTFGTGSGGEKAIMLTMPQFAAAAAHYRSADPQAPRIILLDEAFVGIDNDSRSKAMGLLTHFELDVLMTSEREWACYPTVPGIAIYQLAARVGVDAVLATRWVWNGSHKFRSDTASSELY